MQLKRIRLLTILATFIALSTQGAFAQDNTNPKDDPDQIGNRNVGKGVNFYSIEKEIALGKQMAQEVERQAKIVNDPMIAEYVNRIGQNLVRNSDAKVPFTIKVIDSEEVNAFALPGGFFFVNSGLILKADTEAELAGVMAHEIAHVAARHGTRRHQRRTSADRQHRRGDRMPVAGPVCESERAPADDPHGILDLLARQRTRGGPPRPAVHVQSRL